jgi:hypothetical protein
MIGLPHKESVAMATVLRTERISFLGRCGGLGLLQHVGVRVQHLGNAVPSRPGRSATQGSCVRTRSHFRTILVAIEDSGIENDRILLETDWNKRPAPRGLLQANKILAGGETAELDSRKALLCSRFSPSPVAVTSGGSSLERTRLISYRPASLPNGSSSGVNFAAEMLPLQKYVKRVESCRLSGSQTNCAARRLSPAAGPPHTKRTAWICKSEPAARRPSHNRVAERRRPERRIPSGSGPQRSSPWLTK